MTSYFAWDATKASLNSRKHGVTFGEAATVFADPLAKIADDPDHSIDEERELILGSSARGRLLVVFFCQKDALVRIISARVATRNERYVYEEG